jgi:hypothetical protein
VCCCRVSAARATSDTPPSARQELVAVAHDALSYCGVPAAVVDRAMTTHAERDTVNELGCVKVALQPGIQMHRVRWPAAAASRCAHHARAPHAAASANAATHIPTPCASLASSRSCGQRTQASDSRNHLVELLRDGVPFATACRTMGVSPSAGHEWLYRAWGTHPDLPPAPRYVAFAQAVDAVFPGGFAERHEDEFAEREFSEFPESDERFADAQSSEGTETEFSEFLEPIVVLLSRTFQ